MLEFMQSNELLAWQDEASLDDIEELIVEEILLLISSGRVPKSHLDSLKRAAGIFDSLTSDNYPGVWRAYENQPNVLILLLNVAVIFVIVFIVLLKY